MWLYHLFKALADSHALPYAAEVLVLFVDVELVVDV